MAESFLIFAEIAAHLSSAFWPKATIYSIKHIWSLPTQTGPSFVVEEGAPKRPHEKNHPMLHTFVSNTPHHLWRPCRLGSRYSG